MSSTSPLPWTTPDELSWAGGESAPAFHLASPHGRASGSSSGAHALLADGSVKFLRRTINPAILRAILTINGHELIDSG